VSRSLLYIKFAFTFFLGVIVGVWAMTLSGKQKQVLENTKTASLLRAPELVTLERQPPLKDPKAADRAWATYRDSLVREFNPSDHLVQRLEGTAQLRVDDLDFYFQIQIEPFLEKSGERNFHIWLMSSVPSTQAQTTTTSYVGISSKNQDVMFHFPSSLFVASVKEPSNPVESDVYEKALGDWVDVMLTVPVNEASGTSTIFAVRTLEAGEVPAAVGTLNYTKARSD
jgi:hypothetical protein